MNKSVMSTQPITHIANMISALRAEPVAIAAQPTDDELVNCVYLSFLKIRYPDVGEDTNAIMHAAKEATLELNWRLGEARRELKAEREARRRAVDAFDAQSEEVERLKALLR